MFLPTKQSRTLPLSTAEHRESIANFASKRKWKIIEKMAEYAHFLTLLYTVDMLL
jgi:hypothetical protein